MNRLPVLARTTLGLKRSVPPPVSTTAEAPTASAVRSRAPMLPGFSRPCKINKRVSSRVSRSPSLRDQAQVGSTTATPSGRCRRLSRSNASLETQYRTPQFAAVTATATFLASGVNRSGQSSASRIRGLALRARPTSLAPSTRKRPSRSRIRLSRSRRSALRWGFLGLSMCRCKTTTEEL